MEVALSRGSLLHVLLRSLSHHSQRDHHMLWTSLQIDAVHRVIPKAAGKPEVIRPGAEPLLPGLQHLKGPALLQQHTGECFYLGNKSRDRCLE